MRTRRLCGNRLSSSRTTASRPLSGWGSLEFSSSAGFPRITIILCTDNNPLLLNLLGQARINLQRVGLENFLLIRRAQDGGSVDVAPRVIEVMAGFRIDALDSADHFRGEQNIVGRNDFAHAVDSRLMVHAGIKIYVVQQEFRKRRAFHVLRDSAIA